MLWLCQSTSCALEQGMSLGKTSDMERRIQPTKLTIHPFLNSECGQKEDRHKDSHNHQEDRSKKSKILRLFERRWEEEPPVARVSNKFLAQVRNRVS